jgi:hypothetical protein
VEDVRVRAGIVEEEGRVHVKPRQRILYLSSDVAVECGVVIASLNHLTDAVIHDNRDDWMQASSVRLRIVK